MGRATKSRVVVVVADLDSGNAPVAPAIPQAASEDASPILVFYFAPDGALSVRIDVTSRRMAVDFPSMTP